MYNQLLSKEKTLGVIGLGYVGLPIALEFARKIHVVGFDIKPDRVELMKKKIDPSCELSTEDFEGCDIHFTASPEDLKKVNFFIVAVPTPIDDSNTPDLKPLLSACHSVGKALKKGDYVVFESTVYPGCTEDDCIPILEEESGLKFVTDFKAGFSPERINPGDREHTLTSIIKVVSGCDSESLENIAKTYEIVVKAGVHKASSIKVAESAKIIENTQRDVNIALMNELSIIFNKLGINTFEVLEAAGTKWNFLRFFPGLVGGHCIGVDPYYLTYKAQKLGYHAQIISAGRFVNDSMGGYVAKQTVKKIIGKEKNIRNARVLIMGVTFKENVTDIRNSKVIDIIKELETYKVIVDVVDAFASAHEVKEEYNVDMIQKPSGKYDAVIVAVNHKQYLTLDEKYFMELCGDDGVLIDLKGIYRNKIKNMTYWSL